MRFYGLGRTLSKDTDVVDDERALPAQSAGSWLEYVDMPVFTWSRGRRTIVRRRRVMGAVALSHDDESGAAQLSFAAIGEATEVYEYSVLVTSLVEETAAFAQLYRDRGDDENSFAEMKNPWGWGGFTTRDLARHPFPRLPGLPQWPSHSLAAPPRAELMQPKRARTEANGANL